MRRVRVSATLACALVLSLPAAAGATPVPNVTGPLPGRSTVSTLCHPARAYTRSASAVLSHTVPIPADRQASSTARIRCMTCPRPRASGTTNTPSSQGVKLGRSSRSRLTRLAVPIGSPSTSSTKVCGGPEGDTEAAMALRVASSVSPASRHHSCQSQSATVGTRSGRSAIRTIQFPTLGNPVPIGRPGARDPENASTRR